MLPEHRCRKCPQVCERTHRAKATPHILHHQLLKNTPHRSVLRVVHGDVGALTFGFPKTLSARLRRLKIASSLKMMFFTEATVPSKPVDLMLLLAMRGAFHLLRWDKTANTSVSFCMLDLVGRFAADQ